MDSFLQERIVLVKALAESEDLPVRYADLALITCAVISACAARRWPGRGIDRKRFVELLVQHTEIGFHTSWVSVPALLNASVIRQDQTPYGIPGNEDRIYRDEEIDLSFEDARTKYRAIAPKQLRRYCYASLIYERLRCAYAHEYRSGEDTITVSPSRHSSRVSYIGRIPEMRRKACFHLKYLIELAQHHVSIVPAAPEAPPSEWWSEMA